MKKPRNDYRDVFTQPGSATGYDTVTYAKGGFYEWVWQQERRYLLNVLQRRFQGRSIHYLDFACGPGRVLSFMQPHVAAATGIDISQEALDRAALIVPGATLVRGDVTADPSLLQGPYDLITAFRFFLHAQSDLRDGVMAALTGALSPDGILLFSVHGNARSIRSLGLWYRRWIQGIPSMTLSHTEVDRLVAQHGLRVLETWGTSLLPNPLFRVTPRPLWQGLERVNQKSKWLNRFSTNLIYACGRAPTA